MVYFALSVAAVAVALSVTRSVLEQSRAWAGRSRPQAPAASVPVASTREV